MVAVSVLVTYYFVCSFEHEEKKNLSWPFSKVAKITCSFAKNKCDWW
jgi:hypothetical protein